MQNIFKYKTAAFIILLSTSCLVAFKPAINNIQTKEQNVDILVYYDTTAFANAKDTILHLPNNQLTWADFKAKAQPSQASAAASSVGFKYDANIAQNDENITVSIKVSAFFVKTKSFKKTAQIDDNLLQHEQLHFDLARYGAQLFVNEIASKKLNIKNFDNKLQSAYDDAWETYIDLQRQYDKESNHSINAPQQKKWDEKIKNYLGLCY